MLSLVTTSPDQTASLASIDEQYQQWQRSNTAAYQAHKQKKYALAVEHFKKCFAISKALREHFFDLQTQKSGIELFYFSAHNLSACLNSQQQGVTAKETLLELHNYLIEITTNQTKPRLLRIEALSFLDKSLFSLSSQLAFLNKIESIHTLIQHTESIAVAASNGLFENELSNG